MFPEGRALEFLLAAVIALVVVGPKDLPILMRKLGQFIGRMRAMAAEFRASFDEMARQSELDELRKEVEAMRRGQFADVAARAGHAEIHETFTDIHQNLSGVAADLHGAHAAPYEQPSYFDAPAEPAPPPEVEATPLAGPRPRRRTSPRPAEADVAASPPEPEPRPKPKPRTRKKPEPEA
jgi:sec-independent protein translocase protein TatB